MIDRSPDAAALDGIPLSSVSITIDEVQAVIQALWRGEVSGTGTDVRRLEAELQTHSRTRAAVVTNSGTSALELALQSLGLDRGQEVIVPAFTFAAPASAVLNLGLTPVLCDVDERTWTLDLDLCEGMLHDRTGAIIAVDTMGNPCDYRRLRLLDVPVIEDAAQGIGGTFDQQPLGGLGDLGVYSFHANKVVAGGEGGAVVVHDLELGSKVRLLANHGMTRGYSHPIAGRNARMQNLTAAFIRAQLSRIVGLVECRQAVEERYLAGLEGLPLVWQQTTVGGNRSTWLVAVRTAEREALLQFLRARGVDARGAWPSLSRQPFLSAVRRSTPVAERLAEEVMWLPTHAEITLFDVDRVVSLVKEFFGGPSTGLVGDRLERAPEVKHSA